MIELRAVRGKTGRLLGELLQEKGVLGRPVTGVVSYGVRVRSELPTLNANAGRLDKYEELVRLREKGILVPEHDRTGNVGGVIALGRDFHHTKGRDIVQYRLPISYLTAATKDYWVGLVPKQREFRVWAFRGRVKAVYEKVLRYPRKNRTAKLGQIVWNWRAGYAFVFMRPEAAPQALKETGAQAVTALDLDFGAVDIIQGTDGRYYVLEVNTAPGTEGPRQGLMSLANSIAKWDAGRHPRRNGDVKQGKDLRANR